MDLSSSSPSASPRSMRILGVQIMVCWCFVFFFVHKPKVYVSFLAVLDSANVGILWVALCFTLVSIITAALKIRQLEQGMLLSKWSPQTFYAVEE